MILSSSIFFFFIIFLHSFIHSFNCSFWILLFSLFCSFKFTPKSYFSIKFIINSKVSLRLWNLSTFRYNFCFIHRSFSLILNTFKLISTGTFRVFPFVNQSKIPRHLNILHITWIIFILLNKTLSSLGRTKAIYINTS